MLHLSLALILAGALVTSFSARKGMLHVREGESVETFETNDGKILELPFSVELEGFEVLYHSGTDAASDYSSRLRFTRNGSVLREGEVRMNRILSCKGYRFYQTDYDSDEAGVTFTVSHDPVGIAVIYTGYALLLLGLLAFFFTDKRFKKFFGNALRYSSVIAILLCLEATSNGKCCRQRESGKTWLSLSESPAEKHRRRIRKTLRSVPRTNMPAPDSCLGFQRKALRYVWS